MRFCVGLIGDVGVSGVVVDGRGCGGVVRWVVLFVNVFFVFLSGAGG